MIQTDLIHLFTEAGFLVTRDAVLLLQEQRDPVTIVKRILENVDESVLVVAPPHVEAAILGRFDPLKCPWPVVCER
ncbi:MAG: hypothetical protein WBZ42_04780 [Halobacteriota archaeon]